MMNRREFVKYLALLAAGANALPAQVDAYEKMYDLNTRQFNKGKIVSIKEFTIGFKEPCDKHIRVSIVNKERELWSIFLNQRATFRYVTMPDCPLLTTEGFHIASKPQCSGTIHYIDMDGIIQIKRY